MVITRYHGRYHGQMIAVGASIDALGISRVGDIRLYNHGSFSETFCLDGNNKAQQNPKCLCFRISHVST